MAKVIPSGVLKLPNFAELDYNLRKQREQDELKGQEFLSKFEDIQGTYLPGDIDIVQEAADFFADTIEAAAVDPNDPKLRFKVDRAYKDWVKLAGAAQANFNRHQELRKDFYVNPSNYAISSAEGLDVLDADANTKRTREQLYATAMDPESKIPLAVKQEIKTSDSYINDIFKAFDSRKLDFYDENGSLKEESLNKWLSGSVSNKFLDNPSILNAILAESIYKGDVGVDGKLKAKEFGYVNSPEFINKNKETYISDFQKRILEGVKDLIPKTSISAFDIRKYNDSQTLLQKKFIASGGKGKNPILDGREEMLGGKMGMFYSTAASKISPSVFIDRELKGELAGYKPEYNITGFGFNGEQVFSRRLYQHPDSSVAPKVITEVANLDDLSAIKKAIGSKYYDILALDFASTEQNNNKNDLPEVPKEITNETISEKRKKEIKDLAKRRYDFSQKKKKGAKFGLKIGDINEALYDRSSKDVDSLNNEEKELFKSYLKQIPTTDEEKKVDYYKKVKSYLENKGLNALNSDQLAGFKSTDDNTRDDVASVKSKYKEFVEKEISKIDGSSNFGYESKEEKIKDFIDKLEEDIRKLKSIEELNKYIDSFKSSISEENEMFGGGQKLEEGGKIPSNPLSKIVNRIKNAIYPS